MPGQASNPAPRRPKSNAWGAAWPRQLDNTAYQTAPKYVLCYFLLNLILYVKTVSILEVIAVVWIVLVGADIKDSYWASSC
jgi:hypothetical protein